MKNRRRPLRGGTLIEMLVAVTIMAIFGALVSSTMHRLDTGRFPNPEQGLAALRNAPLGVEQRDGPYPESDVPLDAWGHACIYRYPGQYPNEPATISLGANGLPGGEGENADIVSWKN